MKPLTGNWPPIVAELAYAHARVGNTSEARTLQNELRTATTKRFVDPYLLAVIAIGLGDNDQALARLEEAVVARSGWLPWLKVEPKWDGLHADPRFAALLKRVGLKAGP